MGAKHGKANVMLMRGPLDAVQTKAGQQAKEKRSSEIPRALLSSGGSLVTPGIRGSTRQRSVLLNADLDNERTYAVEPQEIVVEHLEGEPLGGHFLDIDARDLPGMPELDPAVGGSIDLVQDFKVGTAGDSDVAVAVLLSIVPDSPIARFGADHPGVLTVGTVILQAAKVSETATSLTIGRWGWGVVLQKDTSVSQYLHPGAAIEAHQSFARIASIANGGSIQKGWNRKNPQAGVRTGDCVVAVNGVPVRSWLQAVRGDTSTDLNFKLNLFLRNAGERQELVVVRVPGSRHATGNACIAEMIQETLSPRPVPSDGSDSSPRNKAFRASLECDWNVWNVSSASTSASSASDSASSGSSVSSVQHPCMVVDS